jgi:hypothetical protein
MVKNLLIIVVCLGVMPDREMEIMLHNIFGKKGHPVRKLMRMLYWMPKFKNLSPWPLPNPVPNDALELAKLALQRIGSVDLQMKVDVLQVFAILISYNGSKLCVLAKHCRRCKLVYWSHHSNITSCSHDHSTEEQAKHIQGESST